MKNYRVWEANRKVFLYPENWIEPELRDDKSPFFKELENELLQDEINEGTVEHGYRNYLGKLDEVARLDVLGLYREQETMVDSITFGYNFLTFITIVKDVLHVLARTFATPHTYFYRNRNLKTGVWSAWEKVDLNIEGDHLIPVVHNGRLLLFWAVFTEKDDYWDLNIYWSEYRNGNLQARRNAHSSPLIRLELRNISLGDGSIKGILKRDFIFRTSQTENTLKLQLFASRLLSQNISGKIDN